MNGQIKNKTASIFSAALFTLFFLLGFKAVGQSIDINDPDVSPTSGWIVVVPASGITEFDYLEDARVGSGATSYDIVGNDNHPATYIQFSADGSEIAVRIRVNNTDGGNSNSSYQFKPFAYMGIDANLNGTIDFFLGVYSPSGNGRLGIYPADFSAQNSGPGVTGIAKPVATFQPIRGVNYSMIQAVYSESDLLDTNIPFSGNPDYFITFKFNVADISNAIVGKTKENVTFSSETPFTYVIGTSTQENGLNGDINGIDDKSPLPPTWETVITPPVIPDGTHFYTVTFDRTIGDLDASPKLKSVKNGECIPFLPSPPKKRVTKDISDNDVFWEFDGWSTEYIIQNDSIFGNPINKITNEALLALIITNDITVYALWKSFQTQQLVNDEIVHFHPSGGAWNTTAHQNTPGYESPLYWHVNSEDGHVTAAHLPPNPAGSGAGTTLPTQGNPTYVFGGWVIDFKLRQTSSSVPNVINIDNNSQGSVVDPEIKFYIWSDWVNELGSPNQTGYPTIGGHGDEPTVYALWLVSSKTHPRLDFYDNIYTGTPSGVVYGNLLYSIFAANSNAIGYSPSRPTRRGYEFCGWDTNPLADPDTPGPSRYEWENGSGVIQNTLAGKKFSANTNFYAIWKPQKYALLFDANTIDIAGNTVIGTPFLDFTEKLFIDEHDGLHYPAFPSEPALANYTFLGWNTDSQGYGFWAGDIGNVICPGDLIKFTLLETDDLPITVEGMAILGYTRLYALWERDINIEPIETTVIFDAMGGEYTIGDPYYLDGGNKVYYVSGDRLPFQLFDVDAEDGKLTFMPPNPEWPGTDLDGDPLFILTGWSFDSSPSRVADPNINLWSSDSRFLEEGVILYAVWIEVRTITFYPRGGVWPGNTSDPIKVLTDDEGYAMFVPGYYGDPNHPNRDGYNFDNWNTSYDGNGIEYNRDMPVVGRMSVYAQWEWLSTDPEPVFVNVLFQYNDGTDETYYYIESDLNAKISKPIYNPVREDGDWKFDGWYKDSGCINPWDFVNDILDEYNIIEENGIYSLYLYAKWKNSDINTTPRKYILINRHISPVLR